jgi:hypothetical protein
MTKKRVVTRSYVSSPAWERLGAVKAAAGDRQREIDRELRTWLRRQNVLECRARDRKLAPVIFGAHRARAAWEGYRRRTLMPASISGVFFDRWSRWDS